MTRWAAFSIAAVAGTAFVLWQPIPLGDPASCPGLFDLGAIIFSRTWRNVPLASMLLVMNAAVCFITLLLLARAACTLTSSIVAAMTLTLVAAASIQFAPVLASPAAGVCLAVLIAWSGARTYPLVTLSFGPAISPLFAVPAMLIAALSSRKRGAGHAALAAVTVLLPFAIVQAALPQGPSSSLLADLLACIRPAGIDVWRTIGATLAGNPLITALALLGLIARKRPAGPDRTGLLAMGLASAWTGSMAPLVVALWLAAAVGLSEIRGSLTRTAAAKAGAVVLAIAIVILQMVSAYQRRPTAAPSDGHDRLTLAMMTTIVGALPKAAALVEEDAVVDLLTRALPSRMRSSDRFRMLPRNRDQLTTAMTLGPVLALPRSQRELQHLGFELAASDSGLPGLAVIRQAHACTAGLGTALTPLPLPIDRHTFALVADDARAFDRVIVILTGDTPVSVIPAGWPPEFLRGIDGRMFDLTAPIDRTDFIEELRTYEIASSSIPAVRHVSRIEAWRTRGAPLVLPLAINGTVTSAIARALRPTPGHSLRICPTMSFDVRPMAQ